MTLPAPTYDLVMLLDPQAEDDARAKLVADARAAIEAQGEFLRHDDWGTRTLTYPIDRRAVAEYHLLQFHAGTPELLHGLDRTLRIADGILRFRIIKLKPGVAPAPDMRTAASTTEPAPAPATAEAEQAAAPAPTASAPEAPAPDTPAPAPSAPAPLAAETADDAPTGAGEGDAAA